MTAADLSLVVSAGGGARAGLGPGGGHGRAAGGQSAARARRLSGIVLAGPGLPR